MLSIYYILLLFLYIILAPIISILSIKIKYRESIPARFFLFKNRKLDKSEIWIHGCSYGEIRSIESFVSNLDIAITTTTKTGFDYANKLTKNSRYLPFEIFIPFWISQHKKLIILEAEFWLILVYIAKKRDMRVVLLNARISDRSYSKYLIFRWFYRYFFEYIDKVYAQTQLDKDRLNSLGAKNVEVIGNIKALSKPVVKNRLEKPKEILIVCASTHENEEAIILDSLREINISYKLVVAPRHPERFDTVYRLLINSGKTVAKFSKDNSFSSDITIIDSLGNLIDIYAISDIVILGGSFEAIGGHNPIEVAYFETKLISGKNIFNQYALFDMIDNVIFCEKDEIAGAILKAIKSSKVKIKSNIQNIEISKL
jgi:3-deoxy-D-manno-octulosonic-acid transferase